MTGPRLPPAPRRPWYASWWTICAVALVVLVVVGNAARGVGADPGAGFATTTAASVSPSASDTTRAGGTSSSGTPATSGRSATTSRPATRTAATPSSPYATVGETVTFTTAEGSGTVTLNSTRRLTAAEIAGGGTPRQGTYLVVDVTVAVTKGRATADPFLWRAQSTDGRTFDVDLFAVDVLIAGGDINAGVRRSGAVAFDAPPGPLTVELRTPAGDPLVIFSVTH